jgi:hypothetical protein
VKFLKTKSEGFLSILAGFLLLIGAAAFSATASFSDSTASDQDGATSATTSVVDSQEKCTWYLTGIQESISLEVTAGGTGGKYDGTEMTLGKNADADLTVYTSGNQGAGNADGNTECTFYNGKTGVAVANSIGVYSVTATDGSGPDDQMDFDLSSSNPLKITYSQTTCWNGADVDEVTNDWSFNSTAIDMYGVGNNSGSVMSLAVGDTLQVNTTTVSERCSASSAYELKVPANLEPTNPGDNITFTGPSVSFDVTLPNS